MGSLHEIEFKSKSNENETDVAMADLVRARMTAFSPGQSPPPVRTPMRLISVMARSVHSPP